MPTLSSLDHPLDRDGATATVSKTSALREHSRFSDQIMEADCDNTLQDSMVAGAMDELIMAQGAIMEISAAEPSMGHASQMSPPSIHCAFPMPTYGSLPFATSLPRTVYNNNAAIPSSAFSENPLLASVLRAAGETPEALPGADLRQRHADS